MGLIESLPRGSVGIDTAIAIYLTERHDTYLGLSLVELGRPVLLSAARLRAAHGIGTPDAIQVAAALGKGCGSFVTNDRRLSDLPRLRVLQLHDYL